MRGIRTTALAVLLAAFVIGLGAPPASAAAAGGGEMTGTGTLSPGLTTVPMDQTFMFSGTMPGALTIDGVTYAGPITVNMTGNMPSATVLAGSGVGSASLSGSTAGASISGSCSVTVTRVGIWTVIRLDCTITISTPFGTVTARVCLIAAGAAVLTTVLPWSAYLYVGAWVAGCA